MRGYDLHGLRFGKLLVLANEQQKDPNGNRLWLCQCDCGKQSVVAAHRLAKDITRSCGCNRLAVLFKLTHGQTVGHKPTPEYRVWQNMLRRCRKRESKDWKNYGGRGIKVCDRWFSFENFFADMGKRPSRLHTLDRREVNGNYEKTNCQWSTTREQNSNKRSNRFIRMYGEVMTFTEGARRFSVVDLSTARSRRFRGWSAQDAFLTPLGERPRA